MNVKKLLSLWTALTMSSSSLLLPINGIRAIGSPTGDAGDVKRQYDPIVLPISAFSVHTELVRNSQNAQVEYELLLRAGYQHQEKAAYETMSQIRQEQPKNPVALAGYFLAFKMAQGGVNSVRYNGGHKSLSFTTQDDDEAVGFLQKAYQLAPKLWLTYAVDGEDKFYEPGGNRKKAIALLQRAEELAPDNPYPHWLLGDAYTNPPISQTKYQMAANECKKALMSGGRISSAAFILTQIYNLWMPDQTEGIKWKKKFLSLVPPDVKLNPVAKQMLERYPG